MRTRDGFTSTDDELTPVAATARVPVVHSESNGSGTARRWQTKVLRALWRAPLRGILWGLLVGAMAGALAGSLVKQGHHVTYTSRTVMILDDPLGIALSGDEGPVVKLSDLRYKYASLASTEAIAGPVAAELHVPVGVVLGSTSVQVDSSSLLFDVVSTWSTPGLAMEMSAAEAQEIASYIKQENATYKVPASDQFQALVVSPVSQATVSRPSSSKAVTLGFLVLVLGAGIVFVVHQLVVNGYGRRWR